MSETPATVTDVKIGVTIIVVIQLLIFVATIGILMGH
jgi:hypothetical protein